ncbi:cysteine desulfurase family protein [Streptomyces beijiangensis]|uniref:Cysteine desulfurase n=1 Tax=Streptomyces beijiangensis TaxID=163361 RepID=A0A939JHC0_9ACTN|nr:cysteine desulfurase family protein [Streptomyces beijiangensis]MBO0511985.1 cysteine desulfurase [Streptomyces beijiangensis]
MNARPVYLDHQATTPVDPRVVAAMLPYLTTEFGNPSSSHGYGRAAAAAVEAARAQVASLIGAEPDEIVFTSSGTESNHLALTGVAQSVRARGGGRRIVTTTIDHPATQATCDRLAADGFRITRVGVGSDGRLGLPDCARALEPDTCLVSVMHANNEIGTLQPLSELAALTRGRGILLHTDAAQSLASVPTDVGTLGVDLLTVVGHKMYAPKGVGALYIRRGTPSLVPQLVGGGQEHGRRAATENVPGIVALGAAASLALAERDADAARIRTLRDSLLRTLTAGLPGLRVNGSTTYGLPGNLSLTLPAITAQELAEAVPEVAFSAGAACHTTSSAPSPVLTAIGLTAEQAERTIRLGIGRFTSETDIRTAAQAILRAAGATLAHAGWPNAVGDPS